MAEVADSRVDSEKFSVEGGVASFSGRQPTAEKGEGLMITMEDLLKDSPHGGVTGIRGEDEWKARGGETEVRSRGESIFSSTEGVVLGGAPRKGFGLASEGGVERGHDGGDARKEAVVIIDHPHKLLKCLD